MALVLFTLGSVSLWSKPFFMSPSKLPFENSTYSDGLVAWLDLCILLDCNANPSFAPREPVSAETFARPADMSGIQPTKR
jgi:hypothetical protein